MPNGVWKWVAAVLVAVMLAGAPSIVQAIKAPSKEEVNIIRERQQQVLLRLGVMEERERAQLALLQENQYLLKALRAELARHQSSNGGRQ